MFSACEHHDLHQGEVNDRAAAERGERFRVGTAKVMIMPSITPRISSQETACCDGRDDAENDAARSVALLGVSGRKMKRRKISVQGR